MRSMARRAAVCLPHLNERIIWLSFHRSPRTEKSYLNTSLPIMNISISSDLFANFLKCKHKAHLMLTVGLGYKSDYEQLQLRLHQDYCNGAEQHLLRSHDGQAVAQNPSSLSDAIQNGHAVIMGGRVATVAMSCRLDALFRVAKRFPSSNLKYVPVLFVRMDKIVKNENCSCLLWSGIDTCPRT